MNALTRLLSIPKVGTPIPLLFLCTHKHNPNKKTILTNNPKLNEFAKKLKSNTPYSEVKLSIKLKICLDYKNNERLRINVLILLPTNCNYMFRKPTILLLFICISAIAFSQEYKNVPYLVQKIDLSNRVNGIYIVEIRTAKGASTGKLVLSK